MNGQLLMEKDILYAPDFLINAGGLISVYSELVGFNKKQAIHLTEHIYDVTREILRKSKMEQIPTFQAANMLAQQRTEAKRNGQDRESTRLNSSNECASRM